MGSRTRFRCTGSNRIYKSIEEAMEWEQDQILARMRNKGGNR